MKEKEINHAIRQAFEKTTPDVLDSVLLDCDHQEKLVPAPPQHPARSWIRWAAGIAAAFLLFAAGLTCGQLLQAQHAIAAIISLDVNPSIEIQVNPKERVLSVTARNEEARNVIGDMDFTGNSLDVTINALIGSMLRQGYLNETTNSILVSVDDRDPVKGAQLQEKLALEIDGLLQTEAFSGAVLSQSFSLDDELQSLADTYGITAGKALLIQQIIATGSPYRFDDLVPLSINELNLLTHSSQFPLDHVQSVGSASDKAYIGEEKALAAVLSHAGLNQEDISHLTIELEYEHGTMGYDIDFNCLGYEYDYDINAVTGEIISHHREPDEDWTSPENPQTEPQTDPAVKPDPVKPEPSSYLGDTQAISIALSHAGVAEGDVRKLECELDFEDGLEYYEIEFKCGGYEYEYEIDAFDGSIIKYEKEWDD